MSNNKFSTPLEILEFPRASLFTPAPETERERASCQFSILNNNPRISVWPRVPSDTIKAPIAAGFGTPSMLRLLDAMEEIYKGPRGTREACTVEGYPEDENGKGGPDRRKIVKSEVIYGRDDEGICWISVVSRQQERPKLIFKYTGDFFHNFRKGDGSDFAPDEASQRHAIGNVRYLRAQYEKHDAGVTPEQKKAFADSRKSRQGGGQNNNDYAPKPKPSNNNNGFGDEEFLF